MIDQRRRVIPHIVEINYIQINSEYLKWFGMD